jgi:NET1-associated nuclear protein 1 (U3 small nucleolar RNA-associated protein 17)
VSLNNVYQNYDHVIFSKVPHLWIEHPCRTHDVRVVLQTVHPRRLIASPHGSLVGMADNRKIWVWNVRDGAAEHVSSLKSCVLHHTKANKVLAFDPTETLMAGGDNTGRILFWYNVGERTFPAKSSEVNATLLNDGDVKGGVRGTDDAQACTTFHWHANEVKSLLFAVDGTYLFSGGAEETLVIWQPETGKQQFLPRLGGQLYFITSSPDPYLFAISCSDNAIRFVNIATMNVEKSCQGIKPVVPMPIFLKSLNNMGVNVSPQGGNLVLPTNNVALQFYDTVRDCELFEVPIAPRTNISGANNVRNGSTGPSVSLTPGVHTLSMKVTI